MAAGAISSLGAQGATPPVTESTTRVPHFGVQVGQVQSSGGYEAGCGAGWRSEPASVRIELAAAGGVTRGSPGYGSATSTVVRPTIGGSVGMVVASHFVVAYHPQWTRLTLEAGDGSSADTRWHSLGSWRLGLRW